MTQSRSRLRPAHRAHAGLTIAVLLVLLALTLAGTLSSEAAVRLFLLIELPLVLVLVALTVIRFKGVSRSDADGGFLAMLEQEEPLLRPAVYELRAYQSLGLLIAGRRRVPPESTPFGYTRGTMTFPAVILVLSAVELVIVHLIVPWLWLQIVLLILTIWGVLFMAGFFADRIVHPHYVTGDALHLRWGRRTVLVAPLANVSAADSHRSHAYTQPHAEGELLVLTQFQSTNVRVQLGSPVAAAAPVARKLRPADFRAVELLLCVDDPAGFISALQPNRKGTAS